MFSFILSIHMFRLHLKNFIHVYQISGTYQDGVVLHLLPDCNCDYSTNLSEIVRGGFDTTNYDLCQILVEFQADLPCTHARYNILYKSISRYHNDNINRITINIQGCQAVVYIVKAWIFTSRGSSCAPVWFWTSLVCSAHGWSNGEIWEESSSRRSM